MDKIISTLMDRMDEAYIALGIMGKGMLGIFIALTVIFLFTVLLNKIFPEKNKESQTDKTESQ